MNATAVGFYGEQGRAATHFDDRNDGLLDRIDAEAGRVTTMEMETFHLLDLARRSGRGAADGTVIAAAACMGVANRRTGGVVAAARLKELESVAGRAVLEAVAAFEL
jgi:hypothetical protein